MTTVKQQNLEDLGDLRSGYSARSQAEVVELEKATHQILPLRAMPDEKKNPYKIDWSQLEPIIFAGKGENYLLKDGDVLIPVRGFSMITAYVDNPPNKVIIFNNMAVLSPNLMLDGRYLVWWFNHPQTQRRLSRLIMGTMQQFLPLSELRQLKVPVPSKEIQQKIIELEGLRWRERELSQNLAIQRERLFEALTLKLLDSVISNE